MSSTSTLFAEKQSEARAIPHDVAYKQIVMVNVIFVGRPDDRGWVLIDTGIPFSAGRILRTIHKRFGSARPAAIVLTHGHFDHVGAVHSLAECFDVPVYAHELEMPYLTGRSSYPPPDPWAGGGALSWMSPLYPRGPIDLGRRVRSLPGDGTIPGLPGWRWIHTPGHTPGHVSFFRDADRTLIAGDAISTTSQESLLDVLRQRPEVKGPPAYFTSDWQAAWRSVEVLASLRPQLVIPGHGLPMSGDSVQGGLEALAADFDRLAIPAVGRYAVQPGLADARGVIAVPRSPLPAWLPFGIRAGVALAAGAAMWTIVRRRRS